MKKFNFVSLRKLSLIVLLLFSVLLISGCDPNAKVKKRITTEIENIKKELNSKIDESNQILLELKDYERRISNLEDDKSSKEIEKSEYQDDMGSYVIDHGMITLSLIAAGGGIAATLEENLDEDIKTFLQGLGIIGAIYCIINPSECAEVTEKIAWYDDKLNNINDEISKIANLIYELKEKLDLLKERYQAYEGSISSLRTELEEKQEEYNSL